MAVLSVERHCIAVVAVAGAVFDHSITAALSVFAVAFRAGLAVTCTTVGLTLAAAPPGSRTRLVDRHGDRVFHGGGDDQCASRADDCE